MTDTTSAAAVAASNSSLNTMLQTIESGTEVLQRIMPEVAAIGGFVPGATPFIQIAGLALPMVQNAIKWIMQEQNMTAMEALEDFLKHIAPLNGYVSPALSSGPALTGD